LRAAPGVVAPAAVSSRAGHGGDCLPHLSNAQLRDNSVKGRPT
jgi:hypothetical protein